MGWAIRIFTWSVVYFHILNIFPQSNTDSFQSFGLSAGVTFAGPIGKMSRYLEDSGFDYTSSGSWFGPVSYPKKAGPRSDLSIQYAWRQAEKEYEIEFNTVQLGEVTGVSSSSGDVTVGFRSYTLGVHYRFGPRLTKLSLGPVFMLNQTYDVSLSGFSESKEVIDTQFSAGIKVKALLYIWNRKVTYGNLGVLYLFSYASDYGPFAVNENPEDDLEVTKLNFGYGSVFFSVGVKI